MSNQRNNSGMQLSSSNWLENHHNAKKLLRYNFAKQLAQYNPSSILDLGCGTGLWLSVFNDILPTSCKFIGVDLDEKSLEEAKQRAENWERECEWFTIDVNKTPDIIPPADLTLIFNFSSYIENLETFLSYLSREKGFKEIALRQFAGDEIKFGPFTTNEHTAIDLSLKDSIGNSQQIHYFDMDRLIESAALIDRNLVYQDFELFRKFSPFDENTWPYIKGTAEWTLDRMPEYEKGIVSAWLDKATAHDKSLYFYSLDWVAILQ